MSRRIERFNDIGEAQRSLLSHVRPLQESERINVFEAVGRVVATTIYSPKNLPPFNASHMDGFAVNSREVENASEEKPIKLRVVGVCTPGRPPYIKLSKNEAARILTGAYLPEGSDAVIPQEQVYMDGEYVVVRQPVEPWQYVDRQGFDIREGQVIFQTGHRLKAADSALLAALGFQQVEVIRKPRVGIMAIGDELTDRFEEVVAGKVLNTHTHIIRHLVEASGGEPFFLGIVPDSLPELTATIQSYIDKLDMLISIAGSSVSEKDVSSLFASNARTQLYMHGLALQPGRVGGFAVLDGKPFIMLPGLIMSTLNVFMFLAYPTLRYLQHQRPRFYHRRIKALLMDDVRFRKYHDFVKVVWVSVKEVDDRICCYPNIGESSGMSIPSRSDGFLIAMPGVKELTKGSEVWVHYPPAL